MKKKKSIILISSVIIASLIWVSVGQRVKATEDLEPGTCCYEHTSVCFPGIPNTIFFDHFWTTLPGPCN